MKKFLPGTLVLALMLLGASCVKVNFEEGVESGE